MAAATSHKPPTPQPPCCLRGTQDGIDAVPDPQPLQNQRLQSSHKDPYRKPTSHPRHNYYDLFYIPASRSHLYKPLDLLRIPFLGHKNLKNNQNRISEFHRGAECAIYQYMILHIIINTLNYRLNILYEKQLMLHKVLQ